jgi:hypothetical protein
MEMQNITSCFDYLLPGSIKKLNTDKLIPEKERIPSFSNQFLREELIRESRVSKVRSNKTIHEIIKKNSIDYNDRSAFSKQ